jgi:5'-methylthioadenosine/S-adenosylhomocysteine nucleosidase
MKNILFICALPEEKEAVKNVLGSHGIEVEVSKQLNLNILKFENENNTTYLSESGMGNVNAGVNLALILSNILIDEIILIGVGGALIEGLEIGDLILSREVVQHDYYSSLNSGNHLMKPGDLHLSEDDTVDYNPIMQSSASSIDISLIKHDELKIHRGLVSSGSEFVGTSHRKRTINEITNNAILVDMEASAVANVAIKFNIPFLIAKTVSDKLNSDGSIENDFVRFLECASRNAAEFASVIHKVNKL